MLKLKLQYFSHLMWRTDAFKLWGWRRLLWVPWSKEIQPVHPKGNQSWIFIERTDAETEAPILWLPDAKNQFIGKDHDARKDWGQEEKRWQRIRWLDGIIDSTDMNLSNLWERVKDREAWRFAVHGVTKSQTWLSDWTELIWFTKRLANTPLVTNPFAY